MTKPVYQQYHIDTPLTNISVAYNPTTFIAGGVFPLVPVQFVSGKYFVYSKSDWLRREAKVRSPGTRAPRGGYALSTGNYLTAESSFATTVTDEQVRNSTDPLRPLEDGTQFVTRQLLADMESQVAGVVFGNSVWSSSATPSITWDNDTSDPITNVETAFAGVVSTIGEMPNKGVAGYQTWSGLKKHPDIVDRIKGAAGPQSPAVVSVRALAALFGLDDILIGTQIENTGNEGAADSLAYIWGKNFWLGYVTNSAALMTPSAGYVFTYQNRVIERYREDQEKQDVIAGYWNFDVATVAADAGYLLKSVVA